MTSHETPLLLSHGLRRSGVKPTGVQEPPRGAKISTLSFNLRQVAKAAHEGTCSIILTGMEWTGQVQNPCRFTHCLHPIFYFHPRGVAINRPAPNIPAQPSASFPLS